MRSLVDMPPSLSTLITHKVVFGTDLRQRLLLWVFGMTVIGQLWLFPLYAVACSQSLAITVVFIRYINIMPT